VHFLWISFRICLVFDAARASSSLLDADSGHQLPLGLGNQLRNYEACPRSRSRPETLSFARVTRRQVAERVQLNRMTVCQFRTRSRTVKR
jgi:hypothetical protein